jgi:hypothetical protein
MSAKDWIIILFYTAVLSLIVIQIYKRIKHRITNATVMLVVTFFIFGFLFYFATLMSYIETAYNGNVTLRFREIEYWIEFYLFLGFILSGITAFVILVIDFISRKTKRY